MTERETLERKCGAGGRLGRGGRGGDGEPSKRRSHESVFGSREISMGTVAGRRGLVSGPFSPEDSCHFDWLAHVIGMVHCLL